MARRLCFDRKSPSLARRLAAEAVGTGFLLAAVVGSGIMAERLADGNVALALLCNTIATGAILVVLITVFGGVSGAHFNPAVTAAFLVRRDIEATTAAAYVCVQIAGGILGVWAAHAMFGETLIQFSQTVRSGPPQWFAEALATLGLVMAIFGALRWRPEAVAMCVGLYITSAYWFIASTSFANPAVTIARVLTDTVAGIRGIDAPGFVVAQLVGAVLAAQFCLWIFGSRDQTVQSQAEARRSVT